MHPVTSNRTELPPRLGVGTAGWAIPRAAAEAFPPEGSGLERYAAVFDRVEINSTFYRSPRPATLARWAATTPDGFQFAIKAPQAITHEARLSASGEAITRFIENLEPLGAKFAVLLAQLPPSLPFDHEMAEAFFTAVRRARPDLAVACEPRHSSWFSEDPDQLLASLRIARVAADPAKSPGAERPGGWTGFAYWRLHGSPRVYYSAYGDAVIADLASQLQDAATPAWCVFDNTASGAATANALRLRALLAA
jgi:uncharacterized protein YecE (DUF72 family)